MKTYLSRVVCGALIAGLLAGCSSEQDANTNLPKLLATTLISAVKAPKAAAQQVVVTPEMRRKIVTPVLQVNLASTGGSDFLQRVARRHDSFLGIIEVWQSSDNAQIFLRNGVVVGTRGIGRDIIAADAKYAINTLQTGGNRSGQRSFIVSDGDVTTTQFSYLCDMESLGTKSIIVVNQRFAVNHFRETCATTAAGITPLSNEYWVEKSSGVVRKSKQWVGPAAGYFEMILLRK
ncbi:MAG: YjbF family lipoprotein [Sulfitobacter sp.]